MVSFSGGFTETIAGDPSSPLATDLNLGGGATPVTVEIGGDPNNPLTTNMNIGGTKTPLSTDITVRTPDVLHTSSDVKTTSDLKTSSDIKADSRMSVDLRPVVVDTCTTVNFGRVPEMCVRQPYEARYRLTLFGREVMTFEFRGENRTYTENMPDRPAVVSAAWERDRHDRPGRAHHGHGDDPADSDRPAMVIQI